MPKSCLHKQSAVENKTPVKRTR